MKLALIIAAGLVAYLGIAILIGKLIAYGDREMEQDLGRYGERRG